MSGFKVIYIVPSQGGIADYADTIEQIYQRQNFTVQKITIDGSCSVAEYVAKISGLSGDILHLEIGAGDAKVLSVGKQLAKQDKRKQLVTIHDPGVVVRNPIRITLAENRHNLLKLAGKITRKVVTLCFGKIIIAQYLNSKSIVKLYLRQDLVGSGNAYYLPQPTYHPDRIHTKSFQRRKIIAFAGYWGEGKGIETLLDAWGSLLMRTKTTYGLEISGGAAGEDNHYVGSIKKKAKTFKNVSLKGFITEQKLDGYLSTIGVLVLPYWPELPSGTSAMAMRAAELGTPIIASNTPALRNQLGSNGAWYVKPKDPDALSIELNRFCQAAATYYKQAQSTQRQIYAKHNWAVVGSRLAVIIEKTLKNNG